MRRARNLARVGWEPSRHTAASLDEALRDGTHPHRRRLAGAGAPPGDRRGRRVHRPPDRRGRPLPRGLRAAASTWSTSRSRPMPSAARCWRAGRPQAGVVYSLAFGDQPALICDLVDWARTCGFPVVAAGRGHKWLPHFSESHARDGVGLLRPDARAGRARRPEPEDVQQLPRRQQAVDRKHRGRPTPPAWRCRATACSYPPASVEDIPFVTRPTQRRRRARAQGHGRGDLVARGRRPQDPLRHPHGRVGHGRGRDRVHPQLLRGIQRPHRSERALLHAVQALAPDRPGSRRVGGQRGAARRGHRRGHRAGTPTWWPPPSATCAPGEMLDGEGGYTVWGKLLPAATSRAMGGLPLGLAHGVDAQACGRQGPEPALG